jgi:tetratricopeptide (TPR) repeat protein
MDERRLGWVIFGAVCLVVLGIYLYALAPTASFWDCGEFLATSYILGVPHPPGTPLYVLIGRLFSLLPISQEIAYRINLFSVLSGALVCGFVYLLVVKLLNWGKEPAPKGINFRVLWPHLAGVSAALLLCGSFTFWDNSIEAEVYSPCALMVVVLLWLALRWRSEVEKGVGDNRLVLLVLFLAFLSAGLHLTPVLVVPALFVFGLLVDRKAMLDLRLLELVGIYLLTLLLAGLPFLENLVLFMTSPSIALAQIGVAKPGWLGFFFLIFGGYLYWLHSKSRLDLRYVLAGLLVLGLAGTIHFYLMIRAGLNPGINECNPSSWDGFLGVLKRSQYEPMRLFPRKTQFFTEVDYNEYIYLGRGLPSIGLLAALWEQLKFYLRYFGWQWRWETLIGFIPIGLGLYGGYEHYRRDRKNLILFGLAFLLASLGLIFYLNLKYSPSDLRIRDPGSPFKFAEVRERDYFFGLSFVLYTIFIGIGIGGVLKRMGRLRSSAEKISSSVLVILFSASFIPLNYARTTNRYNWIPSEYGYNMLASCEGGVLFTNGDNDTFPLWFVQEVPTRIANYKPNFKKDVAIANLSLINTTWYIKQLKRQGAPISFSESEIDRVLGRFRPFLTRDRRPMYLKDVMVRDIIATSAGIHLKYPEDYAMSTQEFQSRVLEGYKGRVPVYFANTVSRDNRVDVEPYLSTEGMVYRVTGTQGPQVNFERTRYLLEEVYRIESTLDPRVYRDENARGLLLNPASTYLTLAIEYQRRGMLDPARKTMEKVRRFELEPETQRYILINLYSNLSIAALQEGDPAQALAYLDSITALGIRDPGILTRRGLIYQLLDSYPQAEREYQAARQLAPQSGEPVARLIDLYLKAGDTAKAIPLLEEWLRHHPTDTTARSLLHRLSG